MYIQTSWCCMKWHCTAKNGMVTSGIVQCGGPNIVKSIRDDGKNARRFVKFQLTTTTILQSGPNFLNEKSGRLQRLS